MSKKKITRNFQSLTWENRSIEEYDLLRHFIEINNCFPNNTLYMGNDIHGYISYDLLDEIIKEKGGEVIFKSTLQNHGIRKIYYLLNNTFILVESIYFKSVSSFANIEMEDTGKIPVSSQVTLLYPNEDVPEELVDMLNDSLLIMKSYPTVGIISRDNNGFYLNEIIIDAEICQDLDLHYGEGFTLFHEKLMKRLTEKNKGISLFHGIHGSGKSYYINKLIYDLKEQSNKKIILVPTNMVAYLLEPEFNSFLMDMLNESNYELESTGDEILESNLDLVNGMIFILEDAEPVLMRREDGISPQSTSNILNLTDGLLNNIFKIQIIATYNTDDNNIDPAIKRDKRLIAKREFKELSLSDAKKLASSIGIPESEINKSMTVAQIYSLLEKDDDEILIDDKRKKNKSGGKAGLKLD